MVKDIYLDFASTTPTRKEVVEEMLPYFTEIYGNPGSFHSIGKSANDALDTAREKIASLLGATSKEIIFTGGGTESINLAIKGFMRLNKNKFKDKTNSKGEQLMPHLIISEVEHHAVLHTAEYLEKHENFEVTYLKVNKYGQVSPQKLKDAIKENTILVSLIYANNEIGTINNISELVKVVKEKSKEINSSIKFHTDACQAAEYLDINVQNLGVDMMTLNSSKIQGPKGVGLLYLKRGTRIQPIIHGGSQEHRLRAGTENVPGIRGFAKALELSRAESEQEIPKITELRDYFIKNFLEKVPKCLLNGHPTQRLPNNINISILDLEGEALLLMMNEYGFCASSGSACTSETLDPSHVVIATGLPYEAAHSSIRISLGKSTTKEQLDLFLEKAPGIIDHLRKISPVDVDFEKIKKEFDDRE